MKKIIVISSFFLILIAISTVGYQMVSANEKVDEIKDQITSQESKETYLTPYGYTLENPNIILDPYGISPLTAMILFETKEEVEVTVTIEGKDSNSTYTNTFQSTNKHYLPIYGLYPNFANKVQIKCGSIAKTYVIETPPIPSDLQPITVENNTNQLTFITSDKYPYAIDNNNEVRWYLTKNYSKKIERLENGNLLLSTDNTTAANLPSGLIEIDLLGKIYKQYNIDDGYYGSYAETPNSLFILSKSLLEIDKQNGSILNQIPLNNDYQSLNYDEKSHIITIANATENLKINKETKEQQLEKKETLINEQEVLLPLYPNNQNYKITKGLKFTTNKETPESDQTIFLINYKKIDQNYKDHNITITQTTDNIQLTGNFNKDEKVYLILDKFLDKKIYDIKTNHTIINKEGLSGKYSLYLKIDHTIYKTNNYIKF